MKKMAYNRKIRRAQLISTYGVGSIVPFPQDESLIIAGIDNWDNDKKEFYIEDERLAARLCVNRFRWPPNYVEAPKHVKAGETDKNLFIGAYRFPQLVYCRKCKHVKWVELTKEGIIKCNHDYDDVENKEQMKESVMIPERFVVACPNGHLMNFPIIEYIHQESGLPREEYINHTSIIRETSNETSTLAGITYRCLTCKAKKSLFGIMSEGSLRNNPSNPTKCPGYMPWLGGKHEDCDCDTSKLRVVQRGGSNVWFPKTISSIYIPPLIESPISQEYRNAIQKISSIVTSDTDDGFLNSLLQQVAAKSNLDFDLLKKHYLESVKEKEEISYDSIDEDSYRKIEYDILKKDSGNDASPLYCKNLPIEKYDSILHKYFKSISLVFKMTETRAFVGFSRLAPSNKTIKEFKEQISLSEEVDWLPAIQNVGEGILIEFNQEAIGEWKKSPNIIERCRLITDNFNKSIFASNKQKTLINPEFIMIHTFSHLLINELSKKCGYGSSSLRERLYVSETNNMDMYGVLIYTSSGDSEGSMGGLVREGNPGKLEDAIINCLKEAEWCSADPVCIESKGQGPNSCNLAACHNCSLLPETSCENGNRILDRGLLIDVHDKKTGYFQKLLDYIEEHLE